MTPALLRTASDALLGSSIVSAGGDQPAGL